MPKSTDSPKATDAQLDEIAAVLIDAAERPEIADALSEPVTLQEVAS